MSLGAAVKVGPYDSESLLVLRVQGDLLDFFGRMEGALSLRVLGVGWYVQLFAGHCHHPVKEALLFGYDKGLG